MAAYQPMQNPVADWGNIGELLLRARQNQKAQEIQRAELMLRQQNADRENARLDEQMRHTAELEQHQRQVDVATVLPKVKNMLTPGHADYDPESAMSLARAYGINLSATQPEMPTAPTRPTLQAQPENPMFGPKAPESMLDEIDPAKANAENEKFYDYDRADANKAAMDKFGADTTEYQAKLADASRRAPTYSGTSPVGPISIDPNSAVAARAEALRQQQEKFAPLANGVDEQFRPVVMGMIQAGMPGSEIAKAIAERQKEMQQDRIKSTYDQTAADKNRHDRAMEAAAWQAAQARAAGAASSEANRNDASTNRNIGTYQSVMKEFENTAGVNKDVAMMKNIGKIHEELNHSPQSPIAQAAAIDTIAQIAQGGKASQGVMNQINNHALGPAEQAWDKVYQATHNGAHSPAWVKSMQDTLSGLRNFASEEQKRVMQGFEAAAGDTSPFAGPEYSALRDSNRRRLQSALGLEQEEQRPAEHGAFRPGTGKRAAPSNPIMDARSAGKRKKVDDIAAKYGL